MAMIAQKTSRLFAASALVATLLSTALSVRGDGERPDPPTARSLFDEFIQTSNREPLDSLLQMLQNEPSAIEQIAPEFARWISHLKSETTLCEVFEALVVNDSLPRDVLKAVRERFTRRVQDTPFAKTAAAAILIKSRSDTEQAEAWMQSRLAHADPEARLRAADALGRFGKPASNILIDVRRLVTDKSAAVRVAAARADWRIAGDAEAVVPVLLRALQEPDKSFGRQPISSPHITHRLVALSCLGAMTSRQAEISEAIVRVLQREHDDELIRIMALRSVAKLHVRSAGTERVLRGIAACDPEPRVRTEAQAALKVLGEGLKRVPPHTAQQKKPGE